MFSIITLLAHAEAPTADKVLAPVKAKAASEQNAIFLHFGASRCVWCRRLDAFLERPDIKPVFDKYFIPVKLVVQENDKNKAQETPGADALLKQLSTELREVLSECDRSLRGCVLPFPNYELLPPSLARLL